MFGGNVNPSRSSAPLKDNKPGGRGNGEPQPEAQGITQGDGFQHHQIDQNETGFHSTHTDPDGNEEHADHASAEEAIQHAHKVFGGQDEGRESDSTDENMSHGEDANDGPDFSGAYSK